MASDGTRKRIRFENVSKRFASAQGGSVTALDAVELEIADGEIHCLLGSSGSGKTTLLRLVNRLEEATSGRVLVDGVDVLERDAIELRRGIGYVIQEGGLLPHRSVARNVGLLCEIQEWDPERTRTRVDELLELVGLPGSEYRDRFPSELSGGQRQRVGVARALALDPEILLLDEPFGALDPRTRLHLQREFRQLQRRLQKTVVLVTHDVNEACTLADRISLLDEGRLVQSGDVDELRENPANDFVREFFAAAPGAAQ